MRREIELRNSDKERSSGQISSYEQEVEKLRSRLNQLEDEEKVQKDSKESLERRMVVQLQDLAIAKMTITELEEKLESRAQLFEGLRGLVKYNSRKNNIKKNFDSRNTQKFQKNFF